MLKVRTKGVVNVMGKDQELLEAARNGQVGIVEKILGQRAKRSGPLARWVLRSAVDFNVFIEKKQDSYIICGFIYFRVIVLLEWMIHM